jgi:hypothetical protein
VYSTEANIGVCCMSFRREGTGASSVTCQYDYATVRHSLYPDRMIGVVGRFTLK